MCVFTDCVGVYACVCTCFFVNVCAREHVFDEYEFVCSVFLHVFFLQSRSALFVCVCVYVCVCVDMYVCVCVLYDCQCVCIRLFVVVSVYIALYV